MGNFAYYNYEDLGIDSTQKPVSTHLFFEITSTGHFYLVDSTRTKVYYSDDKGDSWTQIDVNPISGTDRDHSIISAWHDRSNKIIWFVDCDNDGTADDFDVWKLDYSSNESSPTVTNVGTEGSNYDANSYYMYDIFKEGTDVFVVGQADNAGTATVIVWEVDTGTFTVEDTDTSIYNERNYAHFGVVSGTKYYTFVSPYRSETNIFFFEYDDATTTITMTGGSGDTAYNVPKTNENLMGLAFDGTEYIYAVCYDHYADVRHELLRWSLTNEDFVAFDDLFEVSLQLDRNVDTSNNPPFNREKGFHISSDKVFITPMNYRGPLLLISAVNFPDNIIGLTDQFLICDDGSVFEYTDHIDYIFRGEIHHSRQNYAYMKMAYDSDSINIVPQLFVQIIGPHTSNGSTTSNQVIFEGLCKNPTEGKTRYVVIENNSFEMDIILPKGSKSGRTDQIISDINDDGAPNGPEYIYDGTLSAGEAMGSLTLEGTKDYRTIVDDFAMTDKFIWYLKPQGDLDYNNGTVDSGADLRYDGTTYTDTIVMMKAWKVAKVNQIIVNGGIDSSNGDVYTGQWDDKNDQLENGLNSITVEDAMLNSNTKCQTKADNMGANETERTRVRFKFRKNTYGFIQPGQTITFKYDVSGYMTISEAQYILDLLIFDIKKEIGYAEISSGI